MTDTTLSPAQDERLDDIAYRDPAARVVGWFESPDSQRRRGPIVRRYDDRHICVSTGGRLFEVVGVETPAGHALRKKAQTA